LKILLVHNSHRSGSSSGDDVVFNKESELLERHGHHVIRNNPSNDEYDKSSIIRKLSIILQIPWSFSYYRKIKEIIRSEKPAIIHIHNFFPFISPSVYYSANSAKVPVIQTLHDFRHLCPMAFFMRTGKICEDCKDGNFFKSIIYGCFKGSKLQTIPVALMLKIHYLLKTFQKKNNGYICLTESQKKIFLEASYDNNKLFVKPNFVEDSCETKEYKTGNYAVFIGRLGEEKGIRTLITAWRELSDIPLKIVGDGPDANKFKNLVKKLNINNIEFLGYKPYKECMQILDNARFLIMPSIWYETFGLTIIEAFCHYKPVIASNLGAMADLIRDGKTGLLFALGNPDDLAQKVRQLWKDDDEVIRMGENARKEYEEKYTPEKNYKMLMNIYEKAINMHRKGR
jgi:glycosyltransferase involved in cell wall biosynthesis